MNISRWVVFSLFLLFLRFFVLLLSLLFFSRRPSSSCACHRLGRNDQWSCCWSSRYSCHAVCWIRFCFNYECCECSSCTTDNESPTPASIQQSIPATCVLPIRYYRLCCIVCLFIGCLLSWGGLVGVGKRMVGGREQALDC